MAFRSAYFDRRDERKQVSQLRKQNFKVGVLKLKITTDATRPEFFMTGGFRWREVFAVLSKSERHSENQWIFHRCEIAFYHRAEEYDGGNDPFVINYFYYFLFFFFKKNPIHFLNLFRKYIVSLNQHQ